MDEGFKEVVRALVDRTTTDERPEDETAGAISSAIRDTILKPVQTLASKKEGVPAIVNLMKIDLLPVLRDIAESLAPPSKEEREEQANMIARAISSMGGPTAGATESPDVGGGGGGLLGFFSKMGGAVGKGIQALFTGLGEGLASIGSVKSLLAVAALAGLGLTLSKIFIPAIKEFASVDFDGVVNGGIALVAFSGALFLIGKQFGTFIKGTIALAASTAVLYGFVEVMKRFTGLDFKSIGVGAAALTGLIVATKVAGKAFAQTMKGAVAIAAIGASIIPLAKGLQMLKGVDFKTVGVLATTLTTLGVAVGALIAVIMSGIGGVALAGAIAALAGIGVALIPLASAMDTFGEASEKFVPIVETFGNVINTTLKTAGSVITGIVEGLGGQVESLLVAIVDFSNNVNVENLLAGAAASTKLAAAISLMLGSSALAGILDLGTSIIGSIFGEDPESSMDRLIRLTQALGAFAAAAPGLANAGGQLFGLGQAIRNLFALDFDQARSANFLNAINSAILGFTELKNQVLDQIDDRTATRGAALRAAQLEQGTAAVLAADVAAGVAPPAPPVILQNNSAPVANNFALESTLSPTTSDLELMQMLGYGSVLS
jgi:hypothetical protein